MAISNGLENPRSRSCQISKSYSGSSILLTHDPLVPSQMTLLFPRYSYFNIWPGKLKVKLTAQGHIVGPTSYPFTSLSFHVNRPPHSWDKVISNFELENPKPKTWLWSKGTSSGLRPVVNSVYFLFCFTPDQQFLRYSYFNIWPWKMQGQTFDPVSNWCTSFPFHINRTNYSWDLANSVWSWKNMSKILKIKFAKKNSNRIPPKSNQVISMPTIQLPSFVVIGWVALTLSSKILLINATAMTLGQGLKVTSRYISLDQYFLCPEG